MDSQNLPLRTWWWQPGPGEEEEKAKEQGGERRRARGGGRRCGSRRGKGWLCASLTPQLRPGPGLRLRVRRRRRRRRRRGRSRRRKAGAGLLRAALAAVRGARSLRPRRGVGREARAERGAGTARRDGARGGGALSRAAPVGPLPPPSSAGACALRAPQPLMSCGARGAAGLGGVRPPTRVRTRAGENLLAVPLRGPRVGPSLTAPLRLSHSTPLSNPENDTKLSGDFCFWSFKPRCQSLPPPRETPMHSAVVRQGGKERRWGRARVWRGASGRADLGKPGVLGADGARLLPRVASSPPSPLEA